MNKNTYLRLEVAADPEKCEWLTGRMSILPFESFEETDTGFYAYIPKAAWSDEIQETLHLLSEQFQVTFQQEEIQEQNWNALWEAGFSPVTIGDYCHVRASFHPPGPPVTYEIIIDPRMAFGTGHHATTSLVIRAMKQNTTPPAAVLDYGSGTGLLAILACKQGSTDIIAIDNDPNAVENTRENCDLNGCPRISVLEGDLDILPVDKTFDLILANINRNVLLAAMPALYSKLKPNGKLILSGFVKADQFTMEQRLIECHFKLVDVQEEGEWLCMEVDKC